MLDDIITRRYYHVKHFPGTYYIIKLKLFSTFLESHGITFLDFNYIFMLFRHKLLIIITQDNDYYNINSK